MEPTLFSFIWKYSKKQQLFLLVLTVLSFPFLYASLELPKQIINDAIGAPTDTVTVFGITVTQVQYLLILCVAFLATVIASGLMKMRINTMKGVLAERMLRRLRFTLIHRTMRFPKSYFATTSQGELVSMITSEAEPMGGLMGDAIAQPVFQFGQMMTIVTFLFMQSVWFGLASIALIPLQAWLIPKLQRQINLLNKDRIQQVRQLSSEIGESAAGISDLRANGGWRYRLAQFSYRLGTLFEIRFKIYNKKFFMKFLNNLITQMTPFLFYSVGGYLAITGEVTVGALVAALGAYKDLSGPWKDLLTYYNQVQDMSLRWEIVTERFAPDNMIPEELFVGEPETIPRLTGDIELHNVTVRDDDGKTILEDIDLTIPSGARVAIKSSSAAERSALAQVLTRELLPVQGDVKIAGHNLASLHQAVIAARIGYAYSRPYLFDGTLGDNLLMPLRTRPQQPDDEPKTQKRWQIEAERSGNPTDSLSAEWIDPGLAGLENADQIRDWWFELVEAMGIDEFMFRRTLRTQFDPAQHPALARDVVALRESVAQRLREKNLDRYVYRFDPDRFNPAVPLGGNLLYAAPSRDISPDILAGDGRFLEMLRAHDLDDEAMAIARAVLHTLNQTFGRDGTDHPLFLRLGMTKDMYYRLLDIEDRRKAKGDDAINERERALLLTVPFLLTAEQIGPDFPDEYKEKILSIRSGQAERLRASMNGMFIPVAPDTYIDRMTVMENALFGRISLTAGAHADDIEDVVAEAMNEAGLRRRAAAIIYDLPSGLGGNNLPTVFQERAAFSRAGIKRPDVLILDTALASHDSESRLRTRLKLRELLPDSIMIFMENRFDHPEAYDLFVEIKDGRIDGVSKARVEDEPDATADLSRKLKIISSTELFSGVDGRNQRLLAFSAQWYDATAGQVIFSRGQAPDAAYLCISGQARLEWPEEGGEARPISDVEPGRLIGDLSVITGDPRQLDLVAVSDCSFLRIGAEELRAVVDSDAKVATQLLQTVAGYLTSLAVRVNEKDSTIFFEGTDAASPET
ncbi:MULTISPECIES: ABC transporter transmembrane domain-containing protein [unclassified Ruegeria]|uniref:ABC transporter transmembrane domain-containing protein n=1 Tax=unclassified Ruegeria TaxID=2625375 RepID=UPI001ADBA2B1|nr:MULTISPECIES: ABC transporter transmembrane domain-containing protein [unclassified Ruegeria]MBO9412418.1 cyclic nucleotide-binding domain-containing protein [Ruegeria sp. R8_1]MBO9416344.1 cyclic nucleotide-binding domain-containing protein [Ruegeria sp. R8_2]